ncbi:DUF488 domain-containing protein [Methanobacterium paludis]|uniref:DUF488 domain-containing protein n=1 Tax=Methanobacterium paludis (strain DSM 25820 / JCM 18151 / SWAN1) TaxID=868131 RepID=F6D5P3_METPW|nr:DUF488 domain-containing protein [Methanobacterium paludis]AEG18225.1 protein of unknown function DUF488 [Methanobacterium paludis]
MINIKRSYLPPEEGDGLRILVDRIWPRGVSKKDLKLDSLMKEIAPSSELRKWFAHDPERWDEFRNKYLGELEDKKELIGRLKIMEKFNGTLTLIYSAKDEEHNNAVVLRELLKKKPRVVKSYVNRTHG